MTDREREREDLGCEFADELDTVPFFLVPTTGREVRRTRDGWEAQPWNDNYWMRFGDPLDALREATPPHLR